MQTITDQDYHPLPALPGECEPCPFCGSANLKPDLWVVDDSDYEVAAWECQSCYGAAPARVWNNRPSNDGKAAATPAPSASWARGNVL